MAAIVAPNDGGAESGSRYLTPGLPGLFVLTSTFFSFLKTKKRFLEFYIIFYFSFLFFLLGFIIKLQKDLQKIPKLFKNSFSKNRKKICLFFKMV
ncbi:hypothetical protein LEP1GSC170_4354 [Leptospira interrogans serovar Bataviae str. HAI135]|nr:hypothetical protein LEP1GSC170_4354 [Leptospira interrogans serovar Bataviae str. HAI135]